MSDEYLDSLWKGIGLKNSIFTINNFYIVKDAKDYEVVTCIAHGCSVAKDTDTLWSIYNAISKKLIDPHSSQYTAGELKELIKRSGTSPCGYENFTWKELYTYWDEVVVKKCEEIMTEVIKSALILRDRDERCQQIIESMPYVDNVSCRIAVCGNIKDPTPYLIDEEERVAKIAEIRLNFERKWLNSPVEYKKEIEFIVTALEYGIIKVFDGLTIRDNKLSIQFESVLFSNKTEYNDIDQDIVYNISDKRIFADAIYGLIKQGKITLANNVVKTSQYLQRIRQNKNN